MGDIGARACARRTGLAPGLTGAGNPRTGQRWGKQSVCGRSRPLRRRGHGPLGLRAALQAGRARPWRVPLPTGGGLRAHRRAGRDVRRATPDVTGPCVVAARCPQRRRLTKVVRPLGAVFRGRTACGGCEVRTTTGRPGTSNRGVAAPAPSSASGGARPTASSFPAQLRAGLGPRRLEVPRGSRRAPVGCDHPRVLHPARRGLHVKEGSGPRQTPRAPLRPRGPAASPDRGAR